MKKLLLIMIMLSMCLASILYLGHKRSEQELYYVLPQAKSYTKLENRKMCFEIYSNTNNSLIQYSNQNTYRIIFNDCYYTLNNVRVDLIDQNNIYLYLIECDVIDVGCELFKDDNAILQISNNKYSLLIEIGSISILKPVTYELISIEDFYGSYAYINGTLELVGINIEFINNYNYINSISIGNYAKCDLEKTLYYMLDNEINIIDEIPSYNIFSSTKEYNLEYTNTSYFIPITYSEILTIKEGFILFEIDNNKYYLDIFSFIINELNYYDYKDKMVKCEVVYG